MHAPVEDGLAAWRRVNGCSDESHVEETRTGRAGTPDAGQTATLLVWATCTSGAPVAHWKLTGVGHAWPGSIWTPAREALIGPTTTLLDASTEIWTFVSRHTH
jgi:polyhydroxybutyrate depolymerase